MLRHSIVITAHNEGSELRETIDSVGRNTNEAFEVIVVDDGSTDGCCDGVGSTAIRAIRHNTRVGVAAARNTGAETASGATLTFLDGHQRLSLGCLDQCAQIATARNAIVWPDVRGLDDESPVSHGATFALCPDGGAFTAHYSHARPLSRVSRITSLRAPGYVMPRRIYEHVKWPEMLRGWGGSEAAVSLKAFFLGVPILHLCGPLARHLFKKKFHYEVTSEGFAWNHAVIARVCFSERSWYEYWLPAVFASQLQDAVLRELDAPSIREEQREFNRRKTRPDSEFWRRLVNMPEPACLRRTSTGCGHGQFHATTTMP